MVSWAQESDIQDPELVRAMFSLLRRQYDSIGELLRAMRKSYTISAASVHDTIHLLASLGQIRSLLSVRMGKEEEQLMIDGLRYDNILLNLEIIIFLMVYNMGNEMLLREILGDVCIFGLRHKILLNINTMCIVHKQTVCQSQNYLRRKKIKTKC